MTVEALDWTAFRDSGLLWLVNASVFHPRGWAMEVVFVDDEGVGWNMLGDGQEPWEFADSAHGNVIERFRCVQEFFDSLAEPPTTHEHAEVLTAQIDDPAGAEEIEERALHIIAQWLDMPSVYMGGPSDRSKRKAQDLLDHLAAGNIVVDQGPGQ